MKKCFKTSKPKARGNFSFFRYFNPQKSPHTQFNPITKTYEYYPKNAKRRGIVVWSGSQRGTYIRKKHGELSIKRPR